MRTLRALCALAALAALSPALPAQTTEKKALTLDGARKVIAAALERASKDKSGGAVAVIDDGGNLIALERLDNTFPAAARIAQGKARTAALFQKPTRAFEEIIAKGRTAMAALEDFTPLQGGAVLTVGGSVVGAVGVSGAASAAEDEEIAQAAARALAGMEAAPAAVTHFEKDRVAAAFAKGEVLFRGGSYMVHASRRDQPGEAEVHQKDADVIYVLGGSATLVTGGKGVDPRATEDGGGRGKRIEGGTTRTLKPGDVFLVPAGTPHWFQEVEAPVTYYVVKAR